MDRRGATLLGTAGGTLTPRRLGLLAAALAALAAVAWLGYRRRPPLVPAVSAVDPSVLMDSLTPADLGLPLPPGTRAVQRITRLDTTAGRSTIALLEAPQPVDSAQRFYEQHWSGARRTPGREATFERRSTGYLAIVRLRPKGPGTLLAVTIEEAAGGRPRSAPQAQ